MVFRGEALRAFQNAREEALNDRNDLDELTLLRESSEAGQGMSLEERMDAVFDVATRISRRQVNREHVVWCQLISLFDWIDM